MTALIIAAAVLLAALLGWPVTALVLRLARESAAAGTLPATVPVTEAADSALPEDAPAAEAPREAAAPRHREPATGTPATVLRGGLTIGILERIAVVFCIVFDQPVAIAYVVAIKGLGRYPELKESPAASERFIIGTLASLIWAALVGILGRWLIGLAG
ncbi:hypothetical protein [Arthrobacter russicus]|jgi:hypothetical protein|uniref:MAPEG family protein n=1 Tax=Arthrobacter russicus TaxID=172040 RepID=A0ABU1JE77_9MICC|nr:hypothetical protein [Arthrobacter russicus]MBQ1444454.1 hypothetical protein [Renibacterium sp.]MDR6270710.1 hypothetical protein [Arthrobacter russicus]